MVASNRIYRARRPPSNSLLIFFLYLFPPLRYIRSERSVILINFCLSIICSNALILVGQTQARNKVRRLVSVSETPLKRSLLRGMFLKRSGSVDTCFFNLCHLSALPTGGLRSGGGSPPLLLPLFFLLGADRSLAVLHGCHWSSAQPHHPQALLMPGLG